MFAWKLTHTNLTAEELATASALFTQAPLRAPQLPPMRPLREDSALTSSTIDTMHAPSTAVNAGDALSAPAVNDATRSTRSDSL